MSNLDLTIAKIMKGDTEVLNIMQGDTEVWHNLPYDEEVAWLKSDGTAYINTGIKCTSNIGIEAELYVNVIDSGNKVLFGARQAVSVNANMLLMSNTSNYGWSWRYGNDTKSENATNTSNRPSGDYYITNRFSRKVIHINDVVLTCADANFSTNYDMLIFVYDNGGTVGTPTDNVLVKYFKMYDGPTLVRDFIPVVKNQVAYLYDKVTKTLFANAAESGAFDYPETYDAQVEYLKTDGTAYIDTGVNITSTVRFEIFMNVPADTTDQYWLFGGRGQTSNNQALGVSRNYANSAYYWRYHTCVVTGPSISSIAEDCVFDNKSTSAARICSINGTNATATSNTFSTSVRFILFGYNNAGTVVNSMEDLMVYSAKLYNNSTLVCDFIPVRKNNIGYLYDKVSGKLYGNANSSGAFTYGNDV